MWLRLANPLLPAFFNVAWFSESTALNSVALLCCCRNNIMKLLGKQYLKQLYYSKLINLIIFPALIFQSSELEWPAVPNLNKLLYRQRVKGGKLVINFPNSGRSRGRVRGVRTALFRLEFF